LNKGLVMHHASDSSPFFRLELRHGVAVVRVETPEIRHPDPALEFGADLTRLFAEDGQKDILIDLGAVRYLGSTGFAVLMKFAETVKSGGGRLKLCNLRPDVAVGANIIGLSHLVETFPDEREALASF
jgi:anti-anti-sigma factor